MESSRFLLLAVAPTVGATFSLESADARAAVYEIAQNAADGGIADGTSAHPFPTISACAQIARAGDTCLVHAGTYRETVSPAAPGTATAPIVFAVADGECATVSGTDPLDATFVNTGGSVWVAPVSGPILQMFSNGAMIWEAQWPNRTPGALFDVPKGTAGQGTGVFSVADGGSVSLLVDPSIPPGDWTGATVFILPGYRWQSDSRPVAAYDETTHTITFDTTVPWAEAATQPTPTNQYYLFGSTLALDVQDEWVVTASAPASEDASSDDASIPEDASMSEDASAPAYTLSYYSSDNPSNHALEVKDRLYAFDIAQSYIQIVGFHVFGGAVRLRGNGDVVDSLSIEYPTHLRSFDAYYTEGDVNRIVGNDNVWKNTIIEKSGSAGLIVAGNGNVVENNIANDIAYEATNHAGFDMDDSQANYSGNIFAYNTVNGSGRSGIFQYGAQAGRVIMNSVSNWALLTNDMGGIYAWGTDGNGTEIAYNDVGGTTAFWSNGIYLDDATKHFVVHHNYVHDSTFYGFCLKEDNEYFNNTETNVGTPFLVAVNQQTGMWQNTNLAHVENDLSDGTFLLRVGVLPTVVTDYGYFEAPVHVTSDWQHVVVPFTSMAQPPWFVQEPFDLTSVQELEFTPSTNGDFELDIANLELTGPTPLVVDAFDNSGAMNGLGGYAWAGGSGGSGSIGSDAGVADGSTAMLTYASGVPPGPATYGAMTGTLVMGNSSWAVLTESAAPSSDLSTYTGMSFDVRGVMHGFRVLATGGSPIQDHDDSCPFSTTTVPACALGQGVSIPGIASGVDGGPPDLGAFSSGQPPWQPGAQRPNDATVCGKLADLDAALPPPVPNPWQDAGPTDGGASASSAIAPDASTRDASMPGGPGSAVTPPPGGVSSGCSCRMQGLAGRVPPRGTLVLMASALVVVIARRRRCGSPVEWRPRQS